MCFAVESIRMYVDSTRKLNLTRYQMKFNSIFKLNQLEFLLNYLKKRIVDSDLWKKLDFSDKCFLSVEHIILIESVWKI